MKNIPSFPILLLLLLATSCLNRQNNKTTPNLNEKTFFDLHTYMQEQAKLMNQLPGPWIKTATLNDIKETKKLENIPWEKELKIFTACDINKPAWLEKYQTDSIFKNQILTELQYAAKDSNLLIKNINISFSQEKVSEIHIRKSSSSPLIRFEQNLYYLPQKGYKITQREKVILLKPSFREIALYQKHAQSDTFPN